MLSQPSPLQDILGRLLVHLQAAALCLVPAVTLSCPDLSVTGTPLLGHKDDGRGRKGKGMSLDCCPVPSSA
jgi:hypothetical protein